MKLIIAVVQNEDADAIIDALLENDFRATRLASTGGFLRRGNTTVMIGVQDHQVDRVLDLIREEAHARSLQQQGGQVQTAAATVFVLDLEDYQRL
ncbi:MAG: cyclic-di-AMP receptor [Thermomicrobiaceae bacterium]|nr:cyclic-di-AMP receptor [Thermomicrobiaceae bacterium]